MSTSETPVNGAAGGADPSMEDILASIRRILSEDEAAAANASAGAAPGAAHAAPAAAPVPHTPPHEPPAEEEGVLLLDDSMMIGAPAPDSMPLETTHEPSPAVDPATGLLAPETEAAATASVGTLLRSLSSDRHAEVHRGGPTLEDLVRESLRPMLKSWLDVHLPPLVERAVRTEIERISGRASL